MSDDFLETNWQVALKTEHDIDRSSSHAQQDLICYNTLLTPMKKLRQG